MEKNCERCGKLMNGVMSYAKFCARGTNCWEERNREYRKGLPRSARPADPNATGKRPPTMTVSTISCKDRNRVCKDHDCRAKFYDESQQGTRKYCYDKECGRNRNNKHSVACRDIRVKPKHIRDRKPHKLDKLMRLSGVL